jgi:hypothetical protein
VGRNFDMLTGFGRGVVILASVVGMTVTQPVTSSVSVGLAPAAISLRTEPFCAHGLKRFPSPPLQTRASAFNCVMEAALAPKQNEAQASQALEPRSSRSAKRRITTRSWRWQRRSRLCQINLARRRRGKRSSPRSKQIG